MTATVKAATKKTADAFSVQSIFAALYHLPLYLLPPHTGGQRADLARGGTKII
ncbi:hypothetical protein OIU34_17570 [Pararhizobium sp. BT-229]|uniref:hypothetical protein n=1 Tax=Pararhizobium sp. BT-229 TaxID=2986923 RepID=UPI0021F6D751|nr:hypothetical protein [Pararhizobium sp. BT-229]MCV9963707.1 hypothetical protein [Pararhizobium sp. BT-229]